jgi:OOP family OmpA-OmpF porin
MMKKLNRVMTGLLVAAASMTFVAGAQAQSSMSGNQSSMYVPGSGYVGLSVGKSDFALDNGIGIFSSDQGDTSYGVQAGGYFNNNFGIELGYTDFGTVNRAGGSTTADGVNLSLIGKMPLNPTFNLLGKVGTTYSRTEVSANPGSGIVSGSESGFGLSYGIGVEFVFTPKLSAVLQYESQDMKFAGDRDDRVANTSVGVRYRF